MYATGTDEASFRDTDRAIAVELERHAHELDGFRAALTRSFSAEQVSKWTHLAALRPLGATHSIWGSVRWRKALGKPLGTPLPAGVIVQCTVLQVVLEERPNAPDKEHHLWGPGHPISTWEIPDADSYAVGFWTTQIPGRRHRIQVSLDPNVPWEKPAGSAALALRVIDPVDMEFDAVNSTQVLPPFSIVSAALRPRL